MELAIIVRAQIMMAAYSGLAIKIYVLVSVCILTIPLFQFLKIILKDLH